MSPRSRRLRRPLVMAGAVLAGLLTAGSLWVWWANVRGDPPQQANTAASAAANEVQVARGAYLARVGNCAACHTTRGGTPYAGGAAIPTPFGTVYGSNLTPHAEHGIGRWSSTDFWRALHNGRSRDGRLLVPAFPYTSYTQVTRADADALFAYLHSLPPADTPNQPHALRWPYDQPLALAVWRALYFNPGVHEPDAKQSAEWNRGAYLVRGLGHCAACHTARDSLGGSDARVDLAGGMIPGQNWYAPSLAAASEAGVADWPLDDIVALLKTGVAPRGWAAGPMAEVVLRSTQHVTDEDLAAMADYLKSLPQLPAAPPSRVPLAGTAAARGAKLYEQNCAQCHGERGEGAGGVYPPLAGNRAVTMASAANLVQIVLHGGFAPATAGNPRPYGMPPFVLALSDSDIAAVLSYVRSAWGNQAGAVSELEVNRLRSGMQR